MIGIWVGSLGSQCRVTEGTREVEQRGSRRQVWTCREAQGTAGLTVIIEPGMGPR